MSQIQINEQVASQKARLHHIGNTLISASNRFGLNEETRQIIINQIEMIDDNFLFVIAGEVNAGKSSFVNALLQADICGTSHEICTNEVQKIIYGVEEQTGMQGKISVREHPASILKQLTIVDTPGTNSKEIDHQIITERFIPHANLILFVFMTENIHAETAWNFFRTIKDKWGKKVLFVMTKKDMYSQEQVDSYKKTLESYIIKEGVEPKIFPTSSKLEQDEQEQSGFAALRAYINDEILSSAAQDKVKDDFKTIESLHNQLTEEFSIRKASYEKDQATRNKITTILLTQEDNAKDSINHLVNSCLEEYDRNTAHFLQSLNKEIGFFHLTMRSIRSIFGGEKTTEWLERMNEDLTVQLNRDMNAKIESGTDNIKSDIQYMIIKVKNEIDQLDFHQVQSSNLFTHIDQQRNDMLTNLKLNLTNFIEKSPIFKEKQLLNREVDYSEANIAGGVAAVGAVIGIIAKGSILDVTGGIATGLALLVAGGLAQFKKGKYLKEVRQTITENREKLKQELQEQLNSYVKTIKESIDSQFFAFDQTLKTERIQIQHFEEFSASIQGELKTLKQELQ